MSDWKISKTIVGEEEMADRQVVAYVGKDGDMGMHVHDLSGPPGLPGGVPEPNGAKRDSLRTLRHL